MRRRKQYLRVTRALFMGANSPRSSNGRLIARSWQMVRLSSSSGATKFNESVGTGTGFQSASQGWILYDGGCGFCYRWVHLWQGVVSRRGFALKELQSASADGCLKIPPESLLDDIRVLTPSWKLESGANAYLYVARRIWWAWPLYGIFSLPGFNWLLWRGYRWFSRNRYRISRCCRLSQQSQTMGRDVTDSDWTI
jgi:predicted DCC family thiol-disulfide oxidoreductase YuxK